MDLIEPLRSITLLGFGFVLGLKHALDADHVVAVSTLVTQTKNLKKSSLFGAIWGLGHTTTLLLVGFLILTFKLSFPEKLTLLFEFLVGIVLVILGIGVLRKVIKSKIHFHGHKHGGVVHIHFHSHKGSSSHSNHTHHYKKSFVVGVVHGLAGSAALMLLVLTTVKSIFQGLLYIIIFDIGSILGMLAISTIIGLPFVLTKNFANTHNRIKIIAGVMSIVLGFTIMYEIGFAGGLLQI